MKRIILLFVACVSLSMITSCSKDDTSGSLEGKWEYSKYGFGQNGQEFLFDYEHESGCTKDYIVLTNNTTTEHSFFNPGTGCEEEIYTSTFTRNGNFITTNEDGEVLEILNLTGSDLKLKYIPEDGDDEIPSGGYGILTLKRIN